MTQHQIRAKSVRRTAGAVRAAGKARVAKSDVDGQRPSEYPGRWSVEA